MKASEFKEWREGAGLSVARAAEILGVDRKTAERWEAGERDIPASIDTECRLLGGVPKLYSLRPFPDKLDSVHWRASTHKGRVTVRAPNRRMARQFAALRFGRSARRGSDGDEAPRNPWLDSDLVELVPEKPSKALPAEGRFGVVDVPEIGE